MVSKKLVEELGERVRDYEREREERRTLSGRHAPPVGTCAVCGGRVHGKIEFPWDGRLGGEPPQARVIGWECMGCGLLYGRVPDGTPKR